MRRVKKAVVVLSLMLAGVVLFLGGLYLMSGTFWKATPSQLVQSAPEETLEKTFLKELRAFVNSDEKLPPKKIKKLAKKTKKRAKKHSRRFAYSQKPRAGKGVIAATQQGAVPAPPSEIIKLIEIRGGHKNDPFNLSLLNVPVVE